MVFLEGKSQEALFISKTWSRGQWIKGHVVRASRISHWNALTEKAWEDAV